MSVSESKALMYEAGGVDSKSLVINRAHAKTAMKIFKLYGERVIGMLYQSREQIDKMNACCTHPF
jgi:hypothetical protein